jgi:hypothetical protein
MLKVTADVFSGRPNPSWIITDEQEVRTVLREITQDRSVMASAAPAEAGLGFRGLFVEPMSDEIAQDFELPATLYVSSGAGTTRSQGSAIAERLISLITQSEPTPAATAEALPLEEPLQQFLLQQLQATSRLSVPDIETAPPQGADEPSAPANAAAAAATICYYDLSPYNPGFWNNNATILNNNNCYNYASNKRTDTFAQPGRGCGHRYTAITCAEVTRGALCDGLHRRYDCFPSTEYPRYLVAMVVAPGPGFIDFHWYRKMREGFWGHKPGGTPVRNVDNSNNVIWDPLNCNRGPYTIFCGYFYTCRSQRIN